MFEFSKLLKKVLNSSTYYDEIQLIGGASNLKFLTQFIRSQTNISVLKDFNANEVLSFGGVIALLESDDSSPFKSTKLSVISRYTVALTCNTTQIMCIKGKRCLDNVTEIESPGCDILTIATDVEEVKFKVGIRIPSNLTFSLFFQKPVLDRIESCIDGVCENVKFYFAERNRTEIFDPQVLEALIDQQINQEARLKNIPIIDELLFYLGYIIKYPDQEPAIHLLRPSQEFKDKLEHFAKFYLDGEFYRMDRASLLKVKHELQSLANSLKKTRPPEKPVEDQDEETEFVFNERIIDPFEQNLEDQENGSQFEKGTTEESVPDPQEEVPGENPNPIDENL